MSMLSAKDFVDSEDYIEYLESEVKSCEERIEYLDNINEQLNDKLDNMVEIMT